MPGRVDTHTIIIENKLQEKLRHILGEDKIDSKNKHVFRHCIRLLQRSEDKMHQCLEYYVYENPRKKTVRINEFYQYCKHITLMTEIDRKVWEIYKKICEKKGMPNTAPSYFADRRGQDLYQAIEEWKGESGNTVEEILVDYFTVGVEQAEQFNKQIIYKPRTLLDNFGWNLFMTYVDEEVGGKHLYLRPSEKEKKQIISAQDKLNELEKVKSDYIGKGDVGKHDEINQYVTKNGIDEAYGKYCRPAQEA